MTMAIKEVLPKFKPKTGFWTFCGILNCTSKFWRFKNENIMLNETKETFQTQIILLILQENEVAH